MNTSLRTQITLPKILRDEIETMRAKTGESLGAYLRRAAALRLEQEADRKIELKKLADEFVGAVKNSKLTKAQVIKWQRVMRRDRG